MEYEKADKDAKPEVGNLVLVGLAFQDDEGNVVEERQFYGKIEKITEQEVLIINPADGKDISLPPFFGSYERAKQEYELVETGEMVKPDFITAWTLRL